MLVLLPPSEGKTAPDRGAAVDLDSLSFPDLGPTRARVLDALVAACRRSPEAAREGLGLSMRQLDEISRNARLRDEPAAPAREVYTGVLFDAWDPGSLPARDRRRADARIAIASALFGLVRPGDRIPAYRLSADSSLPRLPPLREVWRDSMSAAISAAAPRGVILDLRSSAYVALGPVPTECAERTVVARVLREERGQRSVVSHHNKATKGHLARTLVAAAIPRDPADLAGLLGASGYRVELSPPTRDDRPWGLDVIVGA